MDKLKTGGNNALDSVSTVSPHQKPVISATLLQAKKSALESKKRMLALRAETGQFVVAVKSTNHSQARFLSPGEIEDLRATKHSVAQRTLGFLRQA